MEIPMGRPPIGKVAMTGAERVRRYRRKHAADKPVTKQLTGPGGGEPYHILRGYMWSTKEAKELAQKNLFIAENKANWAKLDPREIADEVTDARLEIVKKLRRWRASKRRTELTRRKRKE
jgi:hypothetical protein